MTTNPNRACWNPDSLSKPSLLVRKRDPYYEDGRQSRRDCNGLTIFDAPTLDSIRPTDLGSILVGGTATTRRAHARDYLICGGRVQKQVDWVAEQKGDDPPTYSAEAPQDASAIPDEFLGLLANKDFLLPFPLKSALLPPQNPACALPESPIAR